MTDPVRQAITAAVVKGVQAAAQSPTTSTTPADAAQVASQVLTEVAPIVAHATNNENWWQSRVTLGALLTIVAAALGIFGVTFGVADQSKVIDAVITLAPLIGGAITLYGRWVAKKPLGS